MRLKLQDIDLSPSAARGNGEAASAKREGTAIGKLRDDFLSLISAVNTAINHMSSKIEAKKPVAYEFTFVRDEHGLLQRVIATPKVTVYGQGKPGDGDQD